MASNRENSMRAFARRGSTVAARAAAAVFVAAKPWPALSAAIQLVVVNVMTVAEGYRVSKLLGTDVLNDKNEKIGSIDDMIISKDRVLFAVLQVGGFLGIGGYLVAVPYENLVLDESGKKVVLPGATKDELKKLPEFKYRASGFTSRHSGGHLNSVSGQQPMEVAGGSMLRRTTRSPPSFRYPSHSRLNAAAIGASAK